MKRAAQLCPAVFLLCLLCASAFSGEDPHRIVFSGYVDTSWDLYMVNSDGTGLQRLTDGPLDERHPAFSPDGKKIAYTVSDGSLWIYDLEKESTEKADLPEGDYSYPCWSPDGEGLYFASHFGGNEVDDSHIMHWDFREKILRKVFEQSGTQDFVIVSDNSRYLSYSSSTGAPSKIIITELWLFDNVNNTGVQITLLNKQALFPRFIRQGANVLFVLDTGERNELSKLCLESRETKKIANIGNNSFFTLLDNKRVLLLTTRNNRRGFYILDLKTEKISYPGILKEDFSGLMDVDSFSTR